MYKMVQRTPTFNYVGRFKVQNINLDHCQIMPISRVFLYKGLSSFRCPSSVSIKYISLQKYFLVSKHTNQTIRNMFHLQQESSTLSSYLAIFYPLQHVKMETFSFNGFNAIAFPLFLSIRTNHFNPFQLAIFDVAVCVNHRLSNGCQINLIWTGPCNA